MSPGARDFYHERQQPKHRWKLGALTARIAPPINTRQEKAINYLFLRILLLKFILNGG